VQTLPRWLLPNTDRRIAKERAGRDLDERPSISVWHRNRRFVRTNQSVPPLAAAPCWMAGCAEGLEGPPSRRNAAAFLLILSRCKRHEEREFYVRLAVREKWGAE